MKQVPLQSPTELADAFLHEGQDLLTDLEEREEAFKAGGDAMTKFEEVAAMVGMVSTIGIALATVAEQVRLLTEQQKRTADALERLSETAGSIHVAMLERR